MISLEDFVSATLQQIVAGVSDSQKSVGSNGGRVNPDGISCSGRSTRLLTFTSNPMNIVQEIQFDVAVSASEDTATAGGVGIVLAAIALGAKAQSREGTSTVSRIRFSVPVSLPTQSEEPANND